MTAEGAGIVSDAVTAVGPSCLSVVVCARANFVCVLLCPTGDIVWSSNAPVRVRVILRSVVVRSGVQWKVLPWLTSR